MDTSDTIDDAGLPRRFTNAAAVAELARAVVPGGWEGLLVVGLGWSHELVGIALNDRHRALAGVKVHEMIDLAAELRAAALVAVVVRQNGAREPSTFERRAFAELVLRCARAHLPIRDGLILRGPSWWSLSEPPVPNGRRPGAGTRPRKSRPTWSDL
jgi:hypothetical protein